AAPTVFSCVASRNKRGPSSTAPGFRSHTSGVPGFVGKGGYSWSVTSYDSEDHYRGSYLDFYATWLNPSSTAYRAAGLQLRCLSE
ncbi:hypothetical protein, partial [uncultured Rikenella sp.]|uniref:hypothetical protein n=1 Tax=uncultured Rikenella sp. TaxID=368003 RepID=UPI0026071399